MNTLTAEQVDTFRNMILEASENAAKWGDSDMVAALFDANLALASVLVLLQKEEGIAA
jgi:hypothetical protein